MLNLLKSATSEDCASMDGRCDAELWNSRVGFILLFYLMCHWFMSFQIWKKYVCSCEGDATLRKPKMRESNL